MTSFFLCFSTKVFDHEKKLNFLNTFLLFIIFYVRYLTVHLSPPQDYIVPNDAGIEPRTVAILASGALTTRLDLIHYSARSHPQLDL